MPVPYSKAVKALLEVAWDRPDSILLPGLIAAAKDWARLNWPDSPIASGIWIRASRDLINDGSIVKDEKGYKISVAGVDTLAIADDHF